MGDKLCKEESKRKKKKRQKRKKKQKRKREKEKKQEAMKNMKRRRLSLDEHAKQGCNPFFIYLHDVTAYRHQLFNEQYDVFANDAAKWIDDTKGFLNKIQAARE